MSELSEVPTRDVPGVVTRPPAPATESAGPALVDLVQEMRQVAQYSQRLLMQAMIDKRSRVQTIRGQVSLDANGDGVITLGTVPQGAIGRLAWLSLDEAARTPSNPDTSANLWHAVYGLAGAGATSPAAVVAQGSLLDMSPNSPAADAQLPYVYLYGDYLSCPTLNGGETFYAVIDAATASVMVTARGVIILDQPAD